MAIGAVTAALLMAMPATAVAATTADTTPPTAPTNLRVVNTTDFTWLSMTWDRSSDASGNITYYVQKLLVAPDSWGEVGFTTMNIMTLEIGRPGTGGTYRVIATDPSNNASAPSNTLTATTLPDTVPPVMSTVSFDSVAPASVRVSWPRATDNFRVSRYQIFVDGVLVATTSTLNYRARYLTPGTTYTFTVVAVDVSGNLSAPSSPVVVTTTPSDDTEAPSPPVNLKTYGFLGLGCFSELFWEAATDNVDPASALEYELIYEGTTLRVVVGQLSVPVDIDSGAGDIDLYVRTVDRSGNASEPAYVNHPCKP